ncbi:hypothetical protein EST38_g573 [Candolleomyces aberdarensis]|uniref:DUF302 domain-containing protein n=1 Tax=Candolleomyces aberdarensis TaxID=2316362 RepID=A0A4Q2DXK0_9AGAR|nr:hypothetical protein EST38_g573 [Candolleomyces aberdarensis]
MTFTKAIGYCPTQLISYATTASFAVVQGRLEEKIHKSESISTNVLAKIRQAQTADEIVQSIQNVTQGGDFMYFTEYVHGAWMRTLAGNPRIPATVAYTFGNPLIARPIFQEDITAGTFIPLRLIIEEVNAPDAAGTDVPCAKTTISYHLPSSLIPETSNQILKDQLFILDARVEKLVLDVIRETSNL